MELVNSRVLTVLLLLLAGCDTFYGPRIRNDYGFNVDVTLEYSNGESKTYDWPVCRQSFVGKREAQLVKVIFAKDGKVLREFKSEEIQSLVEQDKRVRFAHLWSVSDKGAVPLPNEQVACGGGSISDAAPQPTVQPH